MSGVLVIGAGGHAKVVADILRAKDVPVCGFVDDATPLWGQTRLGLPVLGAIDTYLDHAPSGLVIGIGDNAARQRIAEKLGPRAPWCNAIHPRATVAPSVRLGHGVVIASGAVVNPDAIIGDHVIINTGAIVEHDCTVGRYAHIAPGACLTGSVRAGKGAFIGARAAIIPNRTIGSWAVVGAGAVVVHDVPDRVIAKGIPARW